MIPIRDTIPSRTAPLITWLIILLNGLFFALELRLAEPQLQRVFYLFGVVPARFAHPDWASEVGFPGGPWSYWAFLTSMFLHGGWLHIVGNMWTLWIFGDNVEDRMGPARFLIFYLVCGVAASAVHVWSGPESTVPTVGASGAIAGVMGAYFIMYPGARVVTMLPVLWFYPIFFELPAFVYLGFWYLTQLYSGAFALTSGAAEVGGIAWWAHVGGFLAGMALHPLFLKPRRERRRFEPDEWGLEGAWARPPRR